MSDKTNSTPMPENQGLDRRKILKAFPFLGTALVCPNIAGAVEHPWIKARRLMKELSAALMDCDDGKLYAHVMPATDKSFNGIGSLEWDQLLGSMPVDRVNVLAWMLASELNGYRNGDFHARIYPSQKAGYAVMFAKTDRWEEA